MGQDSEEGEGGEERLVKTGMTWTLIEMNDEPPNLKPYPKPLTNSLLSRPHPS